LGEVNLLLYQSEIPCEDLKRVVTSAVRTKSKEAVDRVLQRAGVTGHVSFQLLLSIVAYRNRRTWFQFHTDSNPERPARLVIEFEPLQVLPNCLRNLPESYRFGVLDLFWRPERVVRAS